MNSLSINQAERFKRLVFLDSKASTLCPIIMTANRYYAYSVLGVPRVPCDFSPTTSRVRFPSFTNCYAWYRDY